MRDWNRYHHVINVGCTCRRTDHLNTVSQTSVISRQREDSSGGMWIWRKCVGKWSSVCRGVEGDKRVENVTKFWYLGIHLYQTDDDWPAVQSNIMRSRSVWGRLRTLLRREGAEPRVSKMFYSAVVQVILLYGLETWVLLLAMKKKLEGTHTEFL